MKITVAAILSTLLFPVYLSAQKYSTHTGRVSFTTLSVWDTITGTNNTVAALINAGSGTIEITVPVKEMTLRCPRRISFSNEMADRFRNHYMEASKYPDAHYSGKIVNIKAINFSKDDTYVIQTEGQLLIHGVSKRVIISGTLSVKGAQVIIAGQFKIKTATYNIQVPESIKKVYLKDVTVWVNCTLQKEELAQQ